MNQISENATHEVAKVLIGNKSDMINERKVSYEQGKQLAENYGIPFFESSAKEAINVEETFVSLGKSIKENLEKGSPMGGGGGSLRNSDKKVDDKKSC